MFTVEDLEKETREVFAAHREYFTLKFAEVDGVWSWQFVTEKWVTLDKDKATCIKKALHRSGYLQEVAAKLQEAQNA